MTYIELIQQFMDRRVTERFSSHEVDVYLFILHCAQKIKTNPIPLPVKFVCEILQISKPTFLKSVISLQEKKLIVKIPGENYTFYKIVGMKESYEGSRSTSFTTRLIRFTRGSIKFTPKTPFSSENDTENENNGIKNDFKGLTDTDLSCAHTPPRKSGIVKDDVEYIQEDISEPKKKHTPHKGYEDSTFMVLPKKSFENSQPVSNAIITTSEIVHEYTIIEPDSAPSGGLEDGQHDGNVVHETVVLENEMAAPTNKKKKKEITPRPAAPPSLRGVAFAQWFLTLIPEHHRERLYDEQTWGHVFDQLRSIEKVDELEIARVCQWARADKFWSTNFYSPLKLRKKQKDSGMQFYFIFLEQSKGKNSAQPTISETAERRSDRLERFAAYVEDEDPEDSEPLG